MPGYSVSAGGGGPSGSDATSSFRSDFIVNNGNQGCAFCSPWLLAAAAVGAVVWFKMR